MNLDSLSAALSHIGNLVGSLTKKNLNSSVEEIKELLHIFGGEAEQHLYRLVLSQLEWSTCQSSDTRSSSTPNGNSSTNGIASLCPITTGKEKESTGSSATLVFSSSNPGVLIQLVQQVAAFIPLHRFANYFALSISSPLYLTKTIRQGWVAGICKLLKLSKIQEAAICLQLLHSSSAEVRNQATSFLKLKLPELVNSYIEAEGGEQELGDLSTETIHLILTNSVHNHREQPNSPLLATDQLKDFISALHKDIPRLQAPLVLLPILYPDDDTLKEKLHLDLSTTMAKNLLDGSLADLVLEIGYNFCSTIEECRNNLASFGIQSITPGSVAKVIGLMVKTHSGLQTEQVNTSLFQIGLQNLSDPNSLWNENKEKTGLQPGARGSSGTSADGLVPGSIIPGISSSHSWNIEIFLNAVLELVPNFNEKEVIAKLDHKGFLVKDRTGLKLLFTALRVLFPGQGFRMEHFPIEHLYKQWQNTEEQVLLLTQIIHNPDIFSFADYPCLMIQTEGLKSLPGLDGRDVMSWKSIELLDILLWLSDIAGHYAIVREVFKYPIQQCPDILVLGLLQVRSPYSVVRRELLMALIPIFLGTHPNSGIVLHHIWHSQDPANVRQMMMQTIADWYMIMENDQPRLSRILDVAQDLKALPLLLNAQPFPFVIDLACLACRREYLKLDKWLTDKIREHGEPFITACIKFLQKRCPQLLGVKEEHLPKSSQLPSETVTTMLACLQSCTINLSQELTDNILALSQHWPVLNRSRQMSLLGFPSQGDPLGGLSSSLGNLNIGSSVTSSMFATPVCSSITLGAMGGLGNSIPPSSPARPISSVTQVAVSSQSSLSTILPSLQLAAAAAPLPPVGAQLQQQQQPMQAASSINIPSSIQSSIRSQSAQPQQSVAQARASSNVPPMDISQIFDIPPMISKEVEDEANSYFQRIYNHPPHPTLSIEEVLEMLKNFHESQNKREREVYSCMLKNLFEEYRFFPTYPNRELILTARLFGGIIEQGLVEYMALGVALRYVLEALQKPHGSKMYYFGIVALDRFRKLLKDYPRYCQHLTAIEHFLEFPPHLIEYINYGTQSQEAPTKPSGPVLPPSMNLSPITPGLVPGPVGGPINPATASLVKPITATTTTTTNAIVSRPQALTTTVGKPSIANTNDAMLVVADKEEKLTPPPDQLQDKIAFIFNNLSQSNLPQKCEELKEVMTDEFWPWVSQYIVMKRVSIENNFHTLYSLFLDQLSILSVYNMVLQETLKNVKVLLRADKSSSNFSDNKSLLKNLGHWLGMMTLAKNKPILHIDIDVKSLLLEAYKKGIQELQYVIPFVAKVVESCAKSRVFKPRNPWTMAIMNVLAELHREPDMKLHLRFEIEVLCRELELNVDELKPLNILKNQEKLTRLKPQLAQPPGKRAESTPIFTAVQGNTWHFKVPSQPTGSSPTDSFKAPITNMFGLPGDNSIAPPSSSTGATPTPPSVLPAQSSTPTQMNIPQAALEPKFAYSDISQSSLRCFDAHVSVTSAQLGNPESQTHLKQLVRHAIELAVQEIISVVMDRSVKVAMQTADHIIKKDFALDPDECNMRTATHLMVRNLAAAHAMMPCREHLINTIAKGIKQGILKGNPNTEHVDHFATTIAQENVGIACAFIQKATAEKAVVEMDKRLATEYEARKLARAEGKRYCDTRVLTYQAERMPEQIRLKVGSVTPQQMVVYNEFGRNIPGFVPKNDVETHEGQENYFLPKPVPISNTYNNNEDAAAFIVVTDRLTTEIDHTIQTFNGLVPASALIPMLHSLLEGLILCRSNRDATAAQLLIKRTVENLLEGVRDLPVEPELNHLALRFRDVHLILLKALCDLRTFGNSWTLKFVAKCWMEVREDIRYNLEVIDWLLKASLISLPHLDEYLSRSIEELRVMPPYTPLLFVMQLVQSYMIDDTSGSVLTESDLPLTLESMVRICQTRHAPDGLITIIEALRIKHDIIASDRLNVAAGSVANPIANSLTSSINRGTANNIQVSSSHHFHSGVTQARDFQDPPQLRERTDLLLRQWIKEYHSPTAGQGSTGAFQLIVKYMDQYGILKTDEIITRFFRICISICRDVCVRNLADAGINSSSTEVRSKCFFNLDAFVRLIALLVKQSGEPSNPNAKINLLNKILGLICGIMLHDIETNGTEFHQLPYHRILIMLFVELGAPEKVLESITYPILMAFTQTLHLLRPSECPGFAYAWLEVVGHRVFIGRMLASTPQQKGWSMYSMLLTDLFKFLAPFLRNVELSKPFTMLYKGTLRVLLVLLHDFPEFLCEYHYTFCDDIPPNCIQMRNLILSAYPHNMRLPDPFMPNLKVDRLPEIAISPKISSNIASLIQPPELKKNLDSYLKNRTPVTFLSELRSYLQVSNDPGNKYNMSVMNALVLYVGIQAISQIQSKGLTPSMPTIAHSAHMDIFENLAVDLDTEGRYLFLIAIANQLRYPNSHTHYFSCTLLYLFTEATTEAIQEQITRVLLERLIGNRPQPWGLLITFIELIKNPSFKFWNHEFVKCAPEIEKIFESVARSCMVPKQSQAEETSA